MKHLLFKFGRRNIFGLGLVLIGTVSGCLLTPVQQAEVAKTMMQQAKGMIEEKAIKEETRPDQGVDILLMPNPEYSPAQVVEIQLAALKNNDRTDDGIAIVFRFASSANKRSTGPLERFKGIIKNPHYRPLLNHLRTSLDPIKIAGNEAVQRVTLVDTIGNEIVYLFFLSKQLEAPCAGCWMTDGVIVEGITPGQTA